MPTAQLADVQGYYLLAIGVSGWLPWVVIGLLVAEVLVANSRSAAWSVPGSPWRSVP